MKRYKIAAWLMIIHGGFMEIGGVICAIPALIFGSDKFNIGQYFSFKLPYFQDNLPLRPKGIHGFGGLGHQIASLWPLAIGPTMAAGPRLALRRPRPPKLFDLSRPALRPVRGARAMD